MNLSINAALSVASSQSRAVASSERVTFRSVRGARIACREWGPPNGPVVFGIHGLSANSLSFIDVAESLAAKGMRVIVPDLRGRNLSPASGDLGWENHARDILALADDVGARTFQVVGHSMGAYIAMKIASLAPSRVEGAVLVDSLGLPEASAAAAIGQPTDRFDRVFKSPDEYVGWVKSKGHIKPFTATWDRMYREEVAPVAGGVKARTSGAAVETDSRYAVTQSFIPGVFQTLWATLPERTLIIRAGESLAPVLGDIVSDTDLALFRILKPSAKTVTVPSNHFSAITNGKAVSTISAFLQARVQ